MEIAMLGWGSLLWDGVKAFDEQHGTWDLGGPVLKIEFSRVSASRHDALTLVVDPAYGAPCRVAYAKSLRSRLEDVISDLRCREGTVLKYVANWSANAARPIGVDERSWLAIEAWATRAHIDAVVWTALPTNFETKSRLRQGFSVDNAIRHIELLDDKGKAEAANYVWRAPDFVDTPLRKALQSEPWFSELGGSRSPQAARSLA